MAAAVHGKSHSTCTRTAQEDGPAWPHVALAQSQPTAHRPPHLQRGPAGPAAVLGQLLLACGRAELQQLVPFQLAGGQAGQQLEEGASWHANDVQVLGHEVPHRAGLGQPRGAGDICREQETSGSWGHKGGQGGRVVARAPVAHLAPEAEA